MKFYCLFGLEVLNETLLSERNRDLNLIADNVVVHFTKKKKKSPTISTRSRRSRAKQDVDELQCLLGLT